MKFLNELNEKMAPGLASDIEGLLQLKKTECEEIGVEYVPKLLAHVFLSTS